MFDFLLFVCDFREFDMLLTKLKFEKIVRICGTRCVPYNGLLDLLKNFTFHFSLFTLKIIAVSDKKIEIYVKSLK